MAPTKKSYWLMKSEPTVYGIDDLKKDNKTYWDGVRNFKARNYMMEMNVGDGKGLGRTRLLVGTRRKAMRNEEEGYCCQNWCSLRHVDLQESKVVARCNQAKSVAVLNPWKAVLRPAPTDYRSSSSCWQGRLDPRVVSRRPLRALRQLRNASTGSRWAARNAG